MKKLLTCLIISSNLMAQAPIDTTLEYLKKQNVQYVDYVFTDIDGNLKEVFRPVSFTSASCKEGLFFDGSSVPGCSNITQSDMLLKPQIDTLTLIPWSTPEVKTARIFCDIYQDATTPYNASPRNILKRVIKQAQDMGYDFYVGPELEFFLFKDAAPADTANYFAAETNTAMYQFKRNLVTALTAQGIPVEKMHHEVAQGQQEISIQYGNALNVADQLIIAKHTITTFAQSVGLKATFMPKPLTGHNGSGMHIHFSLFNRKTKRNAFYDKNDPHHFSSIAKHFIAGVLKHIDELTILFNPTINSYKRLVPGYEAPTSICWAPKNRSSVIRIPEVTTAAGTRAELRSPDPLCNPYLAFAALLQAGLTGIKNKYELPAPVAENLYNLSLEQLSEKGIASLPASLADALALFSKSTIAKELAGERFMELFTARKNKEITDFSTQVTDWELRKYL